MPLLSPSDHVMACCKLAEVNTSAWVELVTGVVVCLVVLGLWLRGRRDPEQRDRRRVVREQETLNLARRMWMSGGE